MLSCVVVLSAAITIYTAPTSKADSKVGYAHNKQLIRKWFPGNAIAWGTSCRESGFYERAINYNTNGTIDRGLFQINSSHNGTRYHYFVKGRGVNIVLDVKKLFRPLYNVRVAWAMSRGGTSWGPWNGGTTYCALGYS